MFGDDNWTNFDNVDWPVTCIHNLSYSGYYNHRKGEIRLAN